MKSQVFWNWVRDETEPESRTLYLNGVIAEESWFSDEVTPAAFKADLTSGSGPITVWINSVAACRWSGRRLSTSVIALARAGRSPSSNFFPS